VGWHTFRHSYATILKSHGEDVKTVQELLRHANGSVTMNLYARAVTDIMRSAKSKVARLVFQFQEGFRGSIKSLMDHFGPVAKLWISSKL
jgi:Phage integrase family